MSSCADKMCSSIHHRSCLDELYKEIICILTYASKRSVFVRKKRNKVSIAGWNRYVRDAHLRARLCFQMWVMNGNGMSDIFTKACLNPGNFLSPN